MARQLETRRWFEQALGQPGDRRGEVLLVRRAPEPRAAAAPPTPAAVTRSRPDTASHFEPLFELAIEHEYYNGVGNSCADFDVSPTPDTATLLGSLGLILRPADAGFSVYHDKTRVDRLECALRADAVSGSGPRKSRFWTRLSFLLALKNPRFINATEMPLDANPTAENFYLSNRVAHGSSAEAILSDGPTVTARDLMPVAPKRFRVRPSHGGPLVHDLAGEPVFPRPSRVPPWVGVDPNVIDLSLLPEGRYLLGGTAQNDGPFLYTAASPAPLCFVDLLFTNPDAGKGGIYPVALQARRGLTATPTRYVLRFVARSTFWVYYVMARSPGVELCDLAIEIEPSEPEEPPVRSGPRPTPRRRPRAKPTATVFGGPWPVSLPDGTAAFKFISPTPLRLEQRSSQKLRLCGKRRGTPGDSVVLVARLAVPSVDHVRPRTRCPHEASKVPDDALFSDVYVYV